MRLSSSTVSRLVMVGLGFSACALPGPNPDEFAEAAASVSQAIDGGYLDTKDTSVVGIVSLMNGGVGSCSGSLIAPNVVLTAQHCVASISTGEGVDCATSKFGATHAATSFYVTTKTSLSQNPADYRGVKAVLVPSEKSLVCGNDIAILVLSQPIDEAGVTPRVPRVDEPIEKGELYYAVGYGQRGASGQSGTRYRRDNLKTRCVGEACMSNQIDVREWLGDTGICQGDSGGPACDEQDRIVGVVSRGGAGCILPVYAHVSSWADFIKTAVVKATTEASIPTPDWATGFPTDRNFNFDVGGPCKLTSDCDSNACLDGYCTRMCNDQGPCPAGYECGSQGYCAKPKAPSNGGGSGETTTEVTEVSACSLTSGQDPTKAMPWIVTAAAALAGSMVRRARRRG